MARCSWNVGGVQCCNASSGYIRNKPYCGVHYYKARQQSSQSSKPEIMAVPLNMTPSARIAQLYRLVGPRALGASELRELENCYCIRDGKLTDWGRYQLNV